MINLEAVRSAIETSGLLQEASADEWLSSLQEGAIDVHFPDGGIVLFDCLGGGMYEAHVLLKARGSKAIEQGKQACREMFEKHGASIIIGRTPVSLKAARFFARRVGFTSLGEAQTHVGQCEMFQMIKGPQ